MQYISRVFVISGRYRLLLGDHQVQLFYTMSSRCTYPHDDHGVQFEEDHFGLFTDKTTGQSTSIRRFTWRNSNNISVQLITYGATITSIKLPDKGGKVEDVVLGFDDIQGEILLLLVMEYFYWQHNPTLRKLNTLLI